MDVKLWKKIKKEGMGTRMKYQIETALSKEEIEKTLNRNCKSLRWGNLGIPNTMLCDVKPKKNQIFVMKTGRRFATYYYGFRGQIREKEDGGSIIQGSFGYHEKSYIMVAILSAILCVIVALLNGTYTAEVVVVSFVVLYLLFTAELLVIQAVSRRRNAQLQKDILAFLHKRIEKKGHKKNIEEEKPLAVKETKAK